MNRHERIRAFTSVGLGLEKNEVRLAEHNLRWKRVFSDEAYLLFHKVGIESLRLYHGGSTAVVGTLAKPILDIIGSVPQLEELDKVSSVFKSLGYEYKGECGIKDRRFSVLSDAENTKSYCHVHIFKEKSKELKEHLLFRDFLRENKEKATRYGQFKKSFDTDRDKYPEAKSQFIQDTLREADLYFADKKEQTLVLLGSAKGHKNTMDFSQRNFKNTKIEVVDLNHLKINPFEYGCSPEDDFVSIIKKMIEVDRVVFATPIYWYAMSTTMKVFFDRFSNLLTGPHKNLGEKLVGTKVDLLSTGVDDELPLGFSIPFNLTSTYFGMDFGQVYYECQK